MPTESTMPTHEPPAATETIAQRVARLRQHFAATTLPEAQEAEGSWDNWTQWDQWNQFHNVI